MKFTLSIQSDNAAFDDDPSVELSRLLRVAAGHISEGSTGRKLVDINGNVVGNFSIEEEEDEQE